MKGCVRLCDGWSSKSEAERTLINKLVEFEDLYFSDMTLKDSVEELTRLKMNDEWVESFFDPFDLSELSIENWKLEITDITDEYEGRTLLDDETIQIPAKNIDDDLSILHEMIHAYDHILKDNKYDRCKQFLIVKLYEKLKPSFPNLVEWITKDNHEKESVPGHYPLFMLKALDLDLRLNKPPGSIYGYAREEMFK